MHNMVMPFRAGLPMLMVLLPMCLVPVFAGEHGSPQLPQNDGASPVPQVPKAPGAIGPSTCENRWSGFLPILGQEACERGYVLPRPFGVSLGYMHQDQPFEVRDVLVNGVDVKGPGVAVVDEVQNEESTVTLRFDAWLLPFWNVYGILGRTDGEAKGPLMVDLQPVFPLLCALPGNNCQLDTNFELDYEGDVMGAGTTLAGGYRSFFAMVDINYTETDLNISTTDATATVVSARVGWNGQVGKFAGVLWAGLMYEDIDQVLDLRQDIGDSILVVSVEQSTKEPLNYIFGGQWDINRSFSVLAEFGVGERTSQMLNATYRF